MASDNPRMIDTTQLLAALRAYQQKLREAGHPAKALVVTQCIRIVKRLEKPV